MLDQATGCDSLHLSSFLLFHFGRQGDVGYCVSLNLMCAIFVLLVFNLPEIKITSQSQTVHVPGCPHPTFYVTLPKPIKVIHSNFCYLTT